jgi:hypothetical protein
LRRACIRHLLDLHRHFRRQEQLVAVDRRRERDAVFSDLAQVAERKHLEAAGVGQDRLLPAHETVQAAVRADRFEARAQPEVKRIAEDDLRMHFLEFAWLDGFHGAVSADGHEDRRFDDAVIQRDAAAARLAVGAEQFEVEAVGGALGGCLLRVVTGGH